MDVPECPGCRELRARNAELEARIVALEGQLRDLLDKLKPPVPPRPITHQPPAPAKKPTGKKPGGQPGHPPALKSLVPAARVNQIVAHVPERCSRCAVRFPKTPGPDDPAPTRHQVAELPPMLATITEHQGHARTCRCCGEVTRAAIPAAVGVHTVGPRLTGVLSYLAGVHGVSKRGVEEIAEHLFDAPIALWTVANREAEMGVALAAAHGEACRAIAGARVKHVDENGVEAGGQEALAVGSGDEEGGLLPDPSPSQCDRAQATGRREAAWHPDERPLVRLRRVAGTAAVVLGSREAELAEAGRAWWTGGTTGGVVAKRARAAVRGGAPLSRRGLVAWRTG